MKYKIVGIHKSDAFYADKEKLVGQICESEELQQWSKLHKSIAGYYYGWATLDVGFEFCDGSSGQAAMFHAVDLQPIPGDMLSPEEEPWLARAWAWMRDWWAE